VVNADRGRGPYLFISSTTAMTSGLLLGAVVCAAIPEQSGCGRTTALA
jgi:hypothetical protein